MGLPPPSCDDGYITIYAGVIARPGSASVGHDGSMACDSEPRGRESQPPVLAVVPMSRAGTGRHGETTLDALGPALAALPTAAHRAFLRLLLDAVVARRHRRHAYPSGWPSFVAVGPTKTGKNLLVAGA